MLSIFCYTGGMVQTNGYFVESAEGGLVVDAPEGMAEWLRTSKRRVTAVLLTHQHFDHCQDVAAIQQEHGARVLAFAPFSRQLTLEFLMGFVSGTRFEVPSFTVDEVLEGRSEVTAGGIRWQLAHVPGHSLDSITFYSAEHGVLFGGDVLFAGSIGRSDFPGGNGELLVSGIQEKVLVLPDETRVLSGHGPETTIGEERDGNPYLT